MELLSWAFAVFIIAGPIFFGAFAVIFNRRFSLDMYRFPKEVWNMDFTEFDLKVGRVFVAVIGAAVMIIGLIVAAQLLF